MIHASFLRPESYDRNVAPSLVSWHFTVIQTYNKPAVINSDGSVRHGSN